MSLIAYEVENLVKRYGRTSANDGLSLAVYQGEVFGLLGPNGAGKTTLVRQMAGLSQPDSGSIRLFGHDLVKHPDYAPAMVALQAQGSALPQAETPARLIEFTGRLRGMAPGEARQATGALLEEFGLGAHGSKRFRDLSGGLKRLVSIATALIGHRPVLIFDEPTNDLDPQIRRVVWNRIRQTASEGATVVLVTHNVVEAEQAMDRVAVVSAGKVLATGTPGDLKERVARQVRLELLFRPDAEAAATRLLSGFGAVKPLGARRYAAVIPADQADEAIRRLLPCLTQLDDFRIVTPNLEDVYLELSGGESLAG